MKITQTKEENEGLYHRLVREICEMTEAESVFALIIDGVDGHLGVFCGNSSPLELADLLDKTAEIMSEAVPRVLEEVKKRGSH